MFEGIDENSRLLADILIDHRITDEVWLEHLDIPFGFVRDYTAKLREGVDIRRPIEAIRVIMKWFDPSTFEAVSTT